MFIAGDWLTAGFRKFPASFSVYMQIPSDLVNMSTTQMSRLTAPWRDPNILLILLYFLSNIYDVADFIFIFFTTTIAGHHDLIAWMSESKSS